MRSFVAFFKKEAFEQLRSGKITILGILFVLLGIMNPAIAKLTPWLLEMLSDSLAESGMTVTTVTVSAMDSWVQFFKNMPLGLIAFAVIESSIFTKEYASGTLTLSLTKGLSRYKVVVSKAVALILLWSFGYLLTAGITYGYNAYFWDNSVAKNLSLSLASWWLFGIFVIALITLFSTVAISNTGVLIGTGGIVLASYLLALLPKIDRFMPTFLTNGNALIYGTESANTYLPSLLIATACSLVSFVISIPILNKKQL